MARSLPEEGKESFQESLELDAGVFFQTFRVHKSFNSSQPARSKASAGLPPAPGDAPRGASGLRGRSIFDEGGRGEAYPSFTPAGAAGEQDLYPMRGPHFKGEAPGEPAEQRGIRERPLPPAPPLPEKKQKAAPGGAFAPLKPEGPAVRDAALPGTPKKEIRDEDAGKVEKRLRSDFSIAMIRLQSNKDLALQGLNNILEYKASFQEAHKHMFSDFGISLRRRRLYDLARRFHQKAHELAPRDEHILFNMARAFYDAGKVDEARSCLGAALDMSGQFKAGHDFLNYIEERHAGN